MKREFMHFVSEPKEKSTPTSKTPEEFADLVEEQIRNMLENGEEYGELRIDIPEDLTPEDAAMLIEEIIKRLGEDEDDD